MDISYGLKEVEEILLNINTQDRNEKLKFYSIIMAILSRLDYIAERDEVPNYNIYKEELLWSVESICGLDEGNGRSVEDHRIWAIGAIKKLKSSLCFNVK